MRDGKTASKSLRVAELAVVLEAMMMFTCTLVNYPNSSRVMSIGVVELMVEN